MSETIPLVLASASPRRKELLERCGLQLTVRPADVDESPLDGEGAERMALRLAQAKATTVAEELSDAAHIVVAADTVVVLDGHALGKPRDVHHAARILSRLHGREHEVVTGFALVRSDNPQGCWSQCVTTRVRFRRLGDDQIAAYVATGEPTDKAGAYGIQGVGAMLVESISGSYTNVVGLPLAEVLEGLAVIGGPRL